MILSPAHFVPTTDLELDDEAEVHLFVGTSLIRPARHEGPLRWGLCRRLGFDPARVHAIGTLGMVRHFAIALSVLAGSQTPQKDAQVPFGVVTDARRREIAVSEFHGTDADGIPRLVAPTRLEKQGAVLDVRVIEASRLSAARLAQVGLAAHRAGRTLTGLEPLYLRHPDVVQPGPPKRVS